MSCAREDKTHNEVSDVLVDKVDTRGGQSLKKKAAECASFLREHSEGSSNSCHSNVSEFVDSEKPCTPRIENTVD